MSKCGKGCMPECEYFTTGGCISPFNCPYKIETGYINSATSIPTYMEQYNAMSDDDIERCLERLSTCKATDVMNFDYSGTLAYIDRLKAENAALRERLEKAVELKARVGDVIYIPWINDGKDAISELPINKISVHKDNFVLYWVDLSKCDKDYMWAAPKLNYTHTDLGSVVFLTREAAEARLAELKRKKK